MSSIPNLFHDFNQIVCIINTIDADNAEALFGSTRTKWCNRMGVMPSLIDNPLAGSDNIILKA